MLARELDRGLVGFRAGVAEEHPVRERRLAQLLREAHHRLREVEIADVPEPAGLLGQRFGELRVSVAERRHADPGTHVDVLVAVEVPETRTLAAVEDHFLGRVVGHVSALPGRHSSRSPPTAVARWNFTAAPQRHRSSPGTRAWRADVTAWNPRAWRATRHSVRASPGAFAGRSFRLPSATAPAAPHAPSRHPGSSARARACRAFALGLSGSNIYAPIEQESVTVEWGRANRRAARCRTKCIHGQGGLRIEMLSYESFAEHLRIVPVSEREPIVARSCRQGHLSTFGGDKGAIHSGRGGGIGGPSPGGRGALHHSA